MRDPVVTLHKALYGHPQAGLCWEQYAEKHLCSQGFVSLEGWSSCYLHPELKLMLTMYVDECLRAGPSKNLTMGWNFIRYGLDTAKPSRNNQRKEVFQMDEPTSIGKYLDAEHIITSTKNKDGNIQQQCHWDMSGYMQQCVDLYLACASKHGKAAAKLLQLKHAPTRVLDIEDTEDEVSGRRHLTARGSTCLNEDFVRS